MRGGCPWFNGKPEAAALFGVGGLLDAVAFGSPLNERSENVLIVFPKSGVAARVARGLSGDVKW